MNKPVKQKISVLEGDSETLQGLTIVKIGGRAAAPAVLEALAREMHTLSENGGGNTFLLVHGGGAEVSRISEVFGLEPTFVDGVRMTSAEEMAVVDMVLCGKMNKDIVRIFRAAGVNALGVSGCDGGLFLGESLDGALGDGDSFRADSSDGDFPAGNSPAGDGRTRTGRVVSVNSVNTMALLEAGFLPVVASPTMDEEGMALNINADEAALALAEAVKAQRLVFISDIPGVLEPASESGNGLDKEKRNLVLIPRLDEKSIEEKIGKEIITGGMIPKVNSSLHALNKGVGAVIIGQYHDEGDLSALLEGRSGTRIEK